MSLNVSDSTVRGTYSRNTAKDSPQVSSQPNSTLADTTDIGFLVEHHRRLVDLLFPFKVAWDGCLYILRWENYVLTVTVAFFLSLLFYFPSLFLSCLTLLLIVSMAIGKYYSQSKSSTILKTRDFQRVDRLDQDLQILHRVRKEQKNAHLVLLEYKQIIQNFEGYVLLFTKCLDYLYRIVLWKSPEVSLCVTVLLCLCFVLFCTVYLRVIASALPILVLCLNRHFLSRTVELWKKGGLFVYHLFKVKPKPAIITEEPAEREQVTAGDALINGELEERSRENSNNSSESMEATSSTSSQVVGDTNQSSNNTARDTPKPNTSLNAPATCAKCNTVFSLLKRKHTCSRCLLIFCGSCVTKEKRALFGATAPAAFAESVRVCADCKVILSERLEVNSTSRTTSVN